MITIKCKQSNHINRYKGKIILENDGIFVSVTANFTETNHFDDFKWQTDIWDKFLLDDVEYIKGEPE